MRLVTKISSIIFLIPFCFAQAQEKFSLTEHFDNANVKSEKIGRGSCQIKYGILSSKDAYLTFGENNWKNYEVNFRARVPEHADQVQICAGFHAANRDDRYFLMLKGGIQHDLYLARLGYMGADDYLALRSLDFIPKPGTWYDFKIQVINNRIRIFLNNEKLPRIDIIDKDAAYAASGKVTLGGSWITNEFDDLDIHALNSNDLKGENQVEYAIAPLDKEQLRQKQRIAYRPIIVPRIGAGRTVISLNGNWLFQPGQGASTDGLAPLPNEKDQNWHVMHVPDFWNPTRIWLYGEHYNTGSKGISDNYFQKETDRCAGYTFDYKKTSIGWYRQWLELPAGIAGKNLQLHFDAISKVAEVYVNGTKAGGHVGMFGEFNVDASTLLKSGKNLIAVKVTRDYVKNILDANKIVGVAVTVEVTQKMQQDLAHDFYGDDPAGIWQPVSLIITDPMRIQDVFIKPSLTGADFEVTVKNYTHQPATFDLNTHISGNETKDELYQRTSLKQLRLEAGEEKTFTYAIRGLAPKLWSPEHPNLYDFRFSLMSAENKQLDLQTIRSGFRTFEVKGDYLYLNGQRYWLRGGNQTAAPLAPNDTLLANRFTQLMHKGNIMVTRTHTSPGTATWMDAYDRNGIGVSYEGTWSWLFLSSSMPAPELVNLWKNEFYDLLKKYRNHPSLLMWTVNNEMKFYENDPDVERAKVKMKVISDVVKQMRVVDPTRPIVFDSNYKRRTKRFGEAFYKDIDDGDIDDVHAYYNWYEYSLFDFFNGEFQKNNKNPGRPLISQEMSTGYTDETGHPSRFYTYVHQNPSSLSGKFAYEYNNPEYFLGPQAFITKELAEALRRSNGQSAGILHFSLSTWFKNIYQADSLEPWPVYYGMRKALQPVLVSAELWGRHFYNGTTIPARICIVNDLESGSALPESQLQWQLVDSNGKTLAAGNEAVASVAHYGREWLEPKITIPQILPRDKVNAKLTLRLSSQDKTISENDYDVLLVNKDGLTNPSLTGKKIVVFDPENRLTTGLDFLSIKYDRAASITDAVKNTANIYIFSAIDSAKVTETELQQIRNLFRKGAHILISESGSVIPMLFPEEIRSVIRQNGEIINMEIPESDIFEGIQPLEMRYLNNNKRESPAIISAAYRINRGPSVIPLASFVKIHGYLSGQMIQRQQILDKIKGFPLIQLQQKGKVLLSEIRFDKSMTDPIAAKLMVNMLSSLVK